MIKKLYCSSYGVFDLKLIDINYKDTGTHNKAHSYGNDMNDLNPRQWMQCERQSLADSFSRIYTIQSDKKQFQMFIPKSLGFYILSASLSG